MMSRILIIGGGLAGLFTALKLAPLPVTVLSGPPITKSTASAWAQGGIAAALGPEDSVEAHIADTVRAGAGLVDEHVVRIMAEDAPDRIMDLVDFGVPFDRDASGFFSLGREGAHSQNRIVRVSGDRAGAAVMAAIATKVRSTPSVHVLEGYSANEILVEDGEVRGVIAAPIEPQTSTTAVKLEADQVILATGGVGGLYAVTTNPPSVRGEGLGMALRAGAVVGDCEFVQFHPTALDVGVDPAPLATEALRGEGAMLINSANIRFMESEHSLAELAPRDIVAMAIHRERQETGSKVYLDCTNAIGKKFPEEFPTVYASCRAAGIDPVTEPIPVAPAAHYHMGGIVTDTEGRSNVGGLWACGEVACTGAHGANRLASNSLLEALVFGGRIADAIKTRMKSASVESVRSSRFDGDTFGAPNAEKWLSVRQCMSDNAGVVRNEERLQRALMELRDAISEFSSAVSASHANALTAAQAVVVAALVRQESRGGHSRSDFPEANDQLAKRRTFTLAEIEKIASEPTAAAPRSAPPMELEI